MHSRRTRRIPKGSGQGKPRQIYACELGDEYQSGGPQALQPLTASSLSMGYASYLVHLKMNCFPCYPAPLLSGTRDSGPCIYNVGDADVGPATVVDVSASLHTTIANTASNIVIVIISITIIFVIIVFVDKPFSSVFRNRILSSLSNFYLTYKL